MNRLATFSVDLTSLADDIHMFVQAVYDDRVLDSMIEGGYKTKIHNNDLNENFYKKEFQKLWNDINH